MHHAIAHTVQVHHLHLAQFGWRGPQWHLKCRGLANTLSATSLSVSVHWRTGTESNRRGSTLKTALKTQCALSTLGVVITYLIKIIPKNRTFACAARAQAQPCSPPYAQHGTLQPATWHTVRHSLPPYATLAAILRLFSSWIVAGWYFAALAQHRQHALTRWPRPPVALLTNQLLLPPGGGNIQSAILLGRPQGSTAFALLRLFG